jgi:hypothetical protein
MLRDTSFRVRSLVVVLLCLLFACSGDARSSEERALSILPKDTQAALVIPLSRWTSLSHKAEASEPLKALLSKLEGHCGLAVAKDVRTLALATRASKGSLLLLEGEVERPALEACMKSLASEKGEELRVSHESDLTVYAGKAEGATLYGRWLKHAVAISTHAEAVRDLTDRMDVRTEESDALRALRKDVVAGALLYAAGRIDGTFAPLAQAAPWLAELRQGIVQVLPSEGFSLRATLAFADADQARSNVKKLEEHRARLSALPMIGVYASTLRVRSEGANGVLELSWDAAQRDALFTLLVGLASAPSPLASAATP